MTSETKKPAPELHDDTKALGDSMRKDMKADPESKSKLYENNLPPGATMEQKKVFDTYDKQFIAAGVYAAGMNGIEAMKADKKLDTYSLEIPMGHKDKVAYTMERVKEIPNRFGNGDTIIRHGAISTTYTVNAGKSGGQLKAARHLINELAAKALSK